MTVPWLENCPHSGDSWCLDCVKKLGEHNWTLQTSLGQQCLEIDSLRRQRAELTDMLVDLRRENESLKDLLRKLLKDRKEIWEDGKHD